MALVSGSSRVQELKNTAQKYEISSINRQGDLNVNYGGSLLAAITSHYCFLNTIQYMAKRSTRIVR
jgi:hypothetical protein